MQFYLFWSNKCSFSERKKILSKTNPNFWTIVCDIIQTALLLTVGEIHKRFDKLTVKHKEDKHYFSVYFHSHSPQFYPTTFMEAVAIHFEMVLSVKDMCDASFNLVKNILEMYLKDLLSMHLTRFCKGDVVSCSPIYL